MGNLGGLEVVVILLVALVVLGPSKLPHAARQVGRALTELRRISSGFQKEMREAMADPIIEAEARGRGAEVVASEAVAAAGATAATDAPAEDGADGAQGPASQDTATSSDNSSTQTSGS